MSHLTPFCMLLFSTCTAYLLARCPCAAARFGGVADIDFGGDVSTRILQGEGRFAGGQADSKIIGAAAFNITRDVRLVARRNWSGHG